MNQSDLLRLIELQKREREDLLDDVTREEIRVLRVTLSKTEAEVADDPSTPFVDESRRPNLNDDGDYLQEQKDKSAAETEAFFWTAFKKLLAIAEPLVLMEMHVGLQQIHVPAQFSGLLDVVKDLAEGGAKTAIDEIKK